ncbi:hypothetical protein JR316_0004330 [Psilocybe cubensis]|uniref:Uncharacterized protein n=2 Tax=Psilocybe cubensis TaxID=181762 RepID=A0ACB8H3K6_PSICU|nr:hypothetical protein JR316_0004330 [Psilocybe cubensis]KAH9482232.1 hypothetical protein JR316_0004330 [Psilocybe cubensis]
MSTITEEPLITPGDIVAVRHGTKGRTEGLVIGSHFDYAGRQIIEVQLDGEVYNAWQVPDRHSRPTHHLIHPPDDRPPPHHRPQGLLVIVDGPTQPPRGLSQVQLELWIHNTRFHTRFSYAATTVHRFLVAFLAKLLWK